MKMMLIGVCRYKEGKSAPKDIGIPVTARMAMQSNGS